MRSIFTNKEVVPSENDLKIALAGSYPLWKKIEAYAKEAYPKYSEEWNFSGEKFGWSYRIKDKKRILIYFLPRDQFFKVAFVFGERATHTILESDISENIKAELNAAKPYAEGRGIRLVADDLNFGDLIKLIEIKISH